MSEILINVTDVEIRVAVTENGILQEVYLERMQKRGLVGNIYAGRVIRVMPGMQAAFVDIGLEKAAFIHVADIANASADSPIHEFVHEGQTITVQVMKDPIATKGARLTTLLSLPSRYLVYTPLTDHVGISQRIIDDAEKERLRLDVQSILADEHVLGGVIVRTVAETVAKSELIDDIRFLKRLWQQVSENKNQVQAPAIIYQELPLYLRVLRDVVRDGLEKIWIDNPIACEQAKAFAEIFLPGVSEKIELYAKERPLFDIYAIEDEIQKALDRKVILKSGGYLVIDQTESMTTIDVNTGAFVGSRTLEETIYKTNLEAATALARQLRVRNLGGIIIIDFIDMADPEHRRQVLRMLEKALEKDSAKTKILGVSELGLVEMTRKRTRESLGQLLCETCHLCHGKGVIKTSETVCYEMMREITRLSKSYGACQFRVVAAQSVVDRFLDEEAGYLADFEKMIGTSIKFQVEALYGQEQYDIILS